MSCIHAVRRKFSSALVLVHWDMAADLHLQTVKSDLYLTKCEINAMINTTFLLVLTLIKHKISHGLS